jgi:hypothetical protein
MTEEAADDGAVRATRRLHAAPPRLNLLVAYPYMNDRVLASMQRLGDTARFLIDSGAFTAFRTGRLIALDDYCRFIPQMPVAPWRYFNLDVIGDGEASDRNYQTMLDRGLRPMPIFTRGAPLEALDRMYETTDVVGIGGLVVAHNRPHRYVKAVMQHVAGRHVHLLGFVEPSWTQYLKPFSCDASSFTRANRYGYVDVYLGDGEFAHLLRNQAAARMPSERILRAIAGMGFDPYALMHWENWTRLHSVARWLAALSWVRYSIDLERRHGTLLFLAASDADLPVLEACYRSVTDNLDIDAARRASMSPRKQAA